MTLLKILEGVCLKYLEVHSGVFVLFKLGWTIDYCAKVNCIHNSIFVKQFKGHFNNSSNTDH